MRNNGEKKKVKWQSMIGKVLPIVVGACIGAGISIWNRKGMGPQVSVNELLIRSAIVLIFMAIGIFIQVIIHEGGHLVCGLLTGYRYVSFRVGGWMWVKLDGKIRLKKLSLVGTGGQCLMSPPDLVEGKMPIVLYNMGGSLFNIIFGALFWWIYIIVGGKSIVTQGFLIAGGIGFLFALINGIPLKLGEINNDGYNAIAITKNPKAQYALWVQLKVNEYQALGKRIKDMPEEWFIMPSEDEMKNSMCVTLGILNCNRLMDTLEFKKADELIEKLLTMDTAMVGIHRHLLICDRIYCELIYENRPEKLEEMLDEAQIKFMKSMRNFPSVLRTQYVYALLGEKDDKNASEFKKQFEKCARTYPYESDIESERELIETAENIGKRI